MLNELEAREHILAQVRPLPTETATLLAAAGRFAAHPLLAVHPLPGFDNSSMDGYAVCFAPGETALPIGTRLRINGEQPAGADRGLRARPGEAIRIFTGAPIPIGAGAVVMQEDVTRSGEEIVLNDSVESGEFIRRAGGDLARGQSILSPGQKLTPQRLGVLASQGLSTVEVHRKPRVAILATGDELRAPGEPLGAGEIYESNSVLLASLAAQLGAEVTVLPRARDDRQDLDARITAGLDRHDALLIAGGVSVGERDFVKERLGAAGVSLDLWRVRVQPGKPFLYGRRPGAADGQKPADELRATDVHVFGLPGNPVSAFVTFLLFARPAILRLCGAGDDQLALPSFPATAGAELINRGDRPHYLRGSVDDRGRFTPTGRQESHALFALGASSALVRVEAGASIPAGEDVRAFFWSI